MMASIGSVSYSISAVCYLALCVMLLTGWGNRPQKTAFAVAATVSALWAGFMAYNALHGLPVIVVDLVELSRDVAWLALLLRLLDSARGEHNKRLGWWTVAATSIVGFSLLLVAAAFQGHYGSSPWLLPGGIDPVIVVFLYLSVTGLVLVEQLFRNSRREALRSVKYLCLGLGGIFAYDFYLYANALMLHSVNIALWSARGGVDALVVPILGIAITRDHEWSSGLFISRRIAFRTTALLGSALYLFAMSAGGYYVRDYGGTWGIVAQTTFLFGAGCLLLILLFSTPLRARLRVLINKHFFRYKYDYRDEWLRFIRTLSSNDAGSGLHERAIQVFAQIIESPGGVLFMRSDGGAFEAMSQWQVPHPVVASEPVGSPFSSFLEQQEWVVNLDEYEPTRNTASGTPGLMEIPSWLREFPQAWLVVPLIVEERLVGFVVLTKPHGQRWDFNWEDCDLLKTVGRQVAGYLLQCQMAQELADARQFEAFNRLSAFVVHDLKNLVAQLSLVVSNASRHMQNPLFMQDVIRTVDNSVGKMNRLLTHLRAGGTPDAHKVPVDVVQLLKETVRNHAANKPAPRYEGSAESTLVLADRDRLSAVMGHIIRNAQDATPADGQIIVRVRRTGTHVIVDIEDTGCGMDETFVRERLFRPFDTTKGGSGMGIGAYEAREFIRALGGEVQVSSHPGHGTRFRFQIPTISERHEDLRYQRNAR
ncbi:MAG: XrtA/PEP-CTERM system histidine kinase PrsK [Acidiferrobacteraceae bacterium]